MGDADDTAYAEAKRRFEAGDEGALDALVAAGHARASYRLGSRLLESADEESRRRGAALMLAAAAAGVAPAQFRYGLLCAQGMAGVPVDAAAAAQWCRLAADQGLGVAQYNLALLYAAGSGVPADADQAARWLRVAAINGVSEAAGCLDLIHADGDDGRPRTWDEARTRASVALERTDPGAPKTMRFADYYLDPCLELVMQRFRLARDEAEDVVQQFFCELEEPLAQGGDQGRVWKDVLRQRYDAERGGFRAYLSRALGNFTRDWLRHRQVASQVGRQAQAGERPRVPDAEEMVAHHAEEWGAALAAFAAAHRDRPPLARAVAVLQAVLVEGLGQAALATRLGITDRTVRSDQRLGAELLIDWASALVPQGDAPIDRAARQAIALLPDWLHHPGPHKRARILLFLALLWRRHQPAS